MTGPLVEFTRFASDGFSRRSVGQVAVLPADVVAVTEYPFSGEGDNLTRIEFSDGRHVEVRSPFAEVMERLWP